MTRCGVVSHPREWEWTGFHEIMGMRRRYRLIDLDRLCWRLGTGSLEEVRKNLEASLAERLARDQVKREPWWTESLAVGSSGFLEKIRPLILSRRETEIVETDSGLWELKETEIPYGQDKRPKNDPKEIKFFYRVEPEIRRGFRISTRCGLHTLKKLLELNPRTRGKGCLEFGRDFRSPKRREDTEGLEQPVWKRLDLRAKGLESK
jgi:hypothetical protein